MIGFKDFFSFRRNRFFWMNLVLMGLVLVAAPVGTLFWLDSYTRHGEAVVVPDLKGMDIRRAEGELAKCTLRCVVTDSAYAKGIPAGAILEQNPAAGQKVKEGRTVYLTVNADSAPRVAIPDIVDNSSFRQAEAKLRALGFRMTEPEYVEGERDWVYGVKYLGRNLVAGEKIPREALLTLCVGDGGEIPKDSLLLDALETERNDRPIVDDSWF